MNKIRANSHEKQVAEAKKYVYSLLSRRMYTKKEIADKLIKRGYSEEVSYDVIKTMEHYGYLNDKLFAEELVRSKRNKKGNISLRYELLQRGVEKNIVDEVLQQSDIFPDEIDIALDIARRRMEFYRNDEYSSAIRKLRNFLIRRGFDYETVQNVIEQIDKERG